MEGLGEVISIVAPGYLMSATRGLTKISLVNQASQSLKTIRAMKAITAELRASGTLEQAIVKMRRIKALNLSVEESLSLLRLDSTLSGRLLGLGDDGLKRFSDDFLDEVFRKAVSDEPKLFESWKILDEAGEVSIRKDIVWLKKVDQWDSAGIQLSKNNGNLQLVDSSGVKLGEFKNGNLIPDKYATSGTPVGDVVNGYQVVIDDTGQLAIKRIPDKTPYSPSELAQLTDHPNAHVLERDGPDVVDEALIKRATTGIAPDGSTLRNPPPYSSKFESPNALKEALSNTKPGTNVFNSGVQRGNIKVVNYTSSNILGKGVANNTNIFTNMSKVLAIYEDLGNGNYQLLTMYPTI